MLTQSARRAAARLYHALAAVVVPFASLAIANPSWAKSAGIDVWNAPEAERELADATRVQERLTAADVPIVNRIAAKEVLVEELIRGRLTLAETTAHFRILNAGAPQFAEFLRENYPDGTDEERAAQNVIDYAAHRVADPAERETVTCRLTAELADMADDDR